MDRVGELRGERERVSTFVGDKKKTVSFFPSADIVVKTEVLMKKSYAMPLMQSEHSNLRKSKQGGD